MQLVVAVGESIPLGVGKMFELQLERTDKGLAKMATPKVKETGGKTKAGSIELSPEILGENLCHKAPVALAKKMARRVLRARERADLWK